MTKHNHDLHEVTVQLHHETAKAWLVSETGEDEDAVWVPKSQCELTEDHRGHHVLEAPEWLLREKGMI